MKAWDKWASPGQWLNQCCACTYTSPECSVWAGVRRALYFNTGRFQGSALPESMGLHLNERGDIKCDSGLGGVPEVPGLFVAGMPLAFGMCAPPHASHGFCLLLHEVGHRCKRHAPMGFTHSLLPYQELLHLAGHRQHFAGAAAACRVSGCTGGGGGCPDQLTTGKTYTGIACVKSFWQ